jgi:hypothetical protein
VYGDGVEFLEGKENENTTYQNICDIVKTVLRRKFIAMSTYYKKQRNLK